MMYEDDQIELTFSFKDAAAKILRPVTDLQSSTTSLPNQELNLFPRTHSTGSSSSMASSLHSDLQTPSYASDIRILMENMQALNINHRQDDFLLSSSSSLKDSGYQGT